MREQSDFLILPYSLANGPGSVIANSGKEHFLTGEVLAKVWGAVHYYQRTSALGVCRASVADIAARALASRLTVSRALAILVRDDYLVKEGGSPGHPASYRVTGKLVLSGRREASGPEETDSGGRIRV